MEHYVILEEVLHDEFYDIAVVHFGFKTDIDDPDKGILLHVPIPKGINETWIDETITKQINKMMEYVWEKNTQCT